MAALTINRTKRPGARPLPTGSWNWPGIDGTKSAWARSWLDWGREPTDAEFGEGVIVVLERGANSGHVGFLEDWDDNRVRLLGGNQGNAVGSAWFPLSRVLGYRVPA